MKKEFLECGKILGAHGVRGLMKVESWCDSPKILAAQKRVFLAECGGGYREARISCASVLGPSVLIGLEEISDRERAQAMRGTVLYLKREDIPLEEGAYFIADLIDLPVIDIDTARVYGSISEVTDVPRGKLYSVLTPQGDTVLLPDADEFIKEIDTDRGVFIRPIPGFFKEL